MAKITFENKVATRISTRPIKNQIRDVDMNEVKASVNFLYDNATYTVELDETFTRSFKAPQNIKIAAVESSAVQEIELEVEGYPYVLGDNINKWMEITVTGEAESTVNLTVQAV